jgi:hypothetical protein
MNHVHIPEHVKLACLLIKDKQAQLEASLNQLLLDLANANGMTGDIQYTKDLAVLYKEEKKEDVPARPDGGA